MDKVNHPKVGQIAKVVKGRDCNQYAAIIAVVDERYVLIADGDKRKFDHPKKKNLLHLELQDSVSEEIANSVQESGRVTNGKLRFALNKFVEDQQIDAQEKGE